MTGGALGSVFGQLFNLSAIERRSLLVAGAAAGMSAVFGTPVAAVLLGIELLVFEWKPRSMIPIAVASALGAVVRTRFAEAGWLEAVPLFPSTAAVDSGATMVIGALIVGLVGGAMAWVLTKVVYGTEDAFRAAPLPLGMVAGAGRPRRGSGRPHRTSGSGRRL